MKKLGQINIDRIGDLIREQFEFSTTGKTTRINESQNSIFSDIQFIQRQVPALGATTILIAQYSDTYVWAIVPGGGRFIDLRSKYQASFIKDQQSAEDPDYGTATSRTGVGKLLISKYGIRNILFVKYSKIDLRLQFDEKTGSPKLRTFSKRDYVVDAGDFLGSLAFDPESNGREFVEHFIGASRINESSIISSEFIDPLKFIRNKASKLGTVIRIAYRNGFYSFAIVRGGAKYINADESLRSSFISDQQRGELDFKQTSDTRTGNKLIKDYGLDNLLFVGYDSNEGMIIFDDMCEKKIKKFTEMFPNKKYDIQHDVGGILFNPEEEGMNFIEWFLT